MSDTSPPEHRWVFPLDQQINTLLSATPLAAPLTGVRSSWPLTDTQQDSLSELIATDIFKREENNHFLLTTAIISVLYL